MAGVGIVPNVELLEVGEEWMASTGPFTCSAEDLADARAAFDDPTIPAPIIKLGHISKLNQGEPAFGRIINAALTDSDHTINGDLAGMPVWLANNLATLYPRRSIEGMRNYTSASGRTYKFVISAVALLGAQYPAVTSLKDIQLVMEAETPEELNLVAEANIAAADDDADTVKGPEMPLFRKNKKVELSVAVDDVRRAFYDSLDAHEDYWLWIREIQIDPPQLIVTDERDESLHRVTYSIAGDEVTFGEPIAVEVIYQDKADVAASGDSGARIVYSTKDESRPAKDSANDLLTNTEVQPMTADQLKAIGLEEGASEQEINAKLAELADLAAKAATASDTPPAEGGDEDKGEGEGDKQTPPGSAPVTVPQAEGEGAATPKTVLVDASAWDDMQSFRQKAQARFEAEEAREKDSFIAAALADGKFTPAVKGDWRKALDTNYDATRKTIEALPKGSVALSEVGHGGTGEDKKSEDEYPAEWTGAFMGGKA